MTWPSDLDLLALAKPFIKQWEGFEPKPYLCPAGKWTIAWGSTRYPNGKPVQEHDYPDGIPLDFADVCLVSSALRERDALRPLVTGNPSLHQAAALICIAYNIGVGVHDGVKNDLADSTLLERLNAGDIAGAAAEFPKWKYIHKDGKPVALDGLLKRRMAEQAMFLTPDNPLPLVA